MAWKSIREPRRCPMKYHFRETLKSEALERGGSGSCGKRRSSAVNYVLASANWLLSTQFRNISYTTSCRIFNQRVQFQLSNWKKLFGRQLKQLINFETRCLVIWFLRREFKVWSLDGRILVLFSSSALSCPGWLTNGFRSRLLHAQGRPSRSAWICLHGRFFIATRN